MSECCNCDCVFVTVLLDGTDTDGSSFLATESKLLQHNYQKCLCPLSMQYIIVLLYIWYFDILYVLGTENYIAIYLKRELSKYQQHI